jgi:hypothetical protein
MEFSRDWMFIKDSDLCYCYEQALSLLKIHSLVHSCGA